MGQRTLVSGKHPVVSGIALILRKPRDSFLSNGTFLNDEIVESEG